MTIGRGRYVSGRWRLGLHIDAQGIQVEAFAFYLYVAWG